MAQNGMEQDEIQTKIKAIQDKRQESQRKTFTKWINSKLSQAPGKPEIIDLFFDLRDGNNLLSLLEVLTDTKQKRVKGKMRLHHVNNMNLALDVLKNYQVKLVNISNTDIVDGERIPTMGLVWSIIHKFQIQNALAHISKAMIQRKESINNNEAIGSQQQEAEDKLLQWCQYVSEGYQGVDVKNFTSSWTNGLAFNAVLHAYRPDLFNYDDLLQNDQKTNLEHAFNVAHEKIGVTSLLEPADLLSGRPDSRTVVMYLSTLYEQFRDMVPSKEIVGEDGVESEMKPQAEIDEYTNSLQSQIVALKSLLTSPAMEDNPLPKDLKSLFEMHVAFSAFLEDLQTNQERVVELIGQSDDILSSQNLSYSYKGFLESDINVLKETWENVYDKVTDKQNRISQALMNEIMLALEVGNQAILKEASNLNVFQQNPTSFHDAYDKFVSFKKYKEDGNGVGAEVHLIKRDCEISLDAFEDDEREEGMEKLKKLAEALSNFNEDINSTEKRLANKLVYETEKARRAMKAEFEAAKEVIVDESTILSDSDAINSQIELCEGTLVYLKNLEDEETFIVKLLRGFAADKDIVDDLTSDPTEEAEALGKEYLETQYDLKNAISRLKFKQDALNQTAKGQFQHWIEQMRTLEKWVTEAETNAANFCPLTQDKELLRNEKRKVEVCEAQLGAKEDEYNRLDGDLKKNILLKQNIAADDPNILVFKELGKNMSALNRKYLDRRERLSEYLMNEILTAIEAGNLALSNEVLKLDTFQEDAVSVHDAYNKYISFKKYKETGKLAAAKVDRERQDCETALAVFDEEEKKDVLEKTKKIKSLLTDFDEYIESTEKRLANNLVHKTEDAKKELEAELSRARAAMVDESTIPNDKETLYALMTSYENILENLTKLGGEEAFIAKLYRDFANDKEIGDLQSSDPTLEAELLAKQYLELQYDLKNAISRLKYKQDALDEKEKGVFQHWLNRCQSLQTWVAMATSKANNSSSLSKDRALLDTEKQLVMDYQGDLNIKTEEYKELANDLETSILLKQEIPEDDDNIVAFRELEKKLNELNRKYIKRQESLQGYMRAMSSDQKERFRQWQRKKKDIEQKLNAIKDKSPPSSPEDPTAEELEEIDKGYELLIKQLEGFKDEVSDFSSFGQNLKTKQLVDEADGKVVEKDIQEAEDNVNFVLQHFIADRRKNQGILLGLQHAERELLDEWSQRLGLVTGQIGTMEDKFGSFSDVTESNVELVESTLKEDLQQLEVKVDNATSFGEQLCRSPRVTNNKKSRISNEVLTVQSQWLKVKNKGSELQFAVQDEQSKHSQIVLWKASVEEILNWIASKEQVLSIHEDATEFNALNKAESTLKQLSSEMKGYQHKIDNLIDLGKTIREKFGPQDLSTATARSDITKVENKWHYLEERCSAALLNIKSQISLFNREEDDKISKWELESAKVDDWLEDVEDKANLFNQPADDIISLEEQVSKHEELVFRLATEEKESDEVLDWGNTLLSGEEIKDVDKRDRVREQLRALRRRKNKLNVKLMSQQESLSSKLDELLGMEAEDMQAWLVLVAKTDKEMDALLSSSEFPSGVTPKEAIENLSQMKELYVSVEDLGNHIEKLGNQARKLTKERRLGRQKAEESKSEIKRLLRKWEELRRVMADRLAKAEEEQAIFKKEWEGQLTGWITQSQVLSNWIHGMLKKLHESSKRDYTDIIFEEVISVEKKLQDINKKIQTKGTDLNDILAEGNMMVDEKSDNIESGDAHNRKEIQATITKLKEDWDDLLSSLDIEMKRLHDHLHRRFSTALADRLEEIDNLEVKSKMLPAVQNNQYSIRHGAEKVAEFTNQLNRLKPKVKVLQRYCEEILGTDLFSVKEQAEIENSTCLLEESFAKLLECTENKKTGVQDVAVQKIRNEITKAVEKLELTQEKQTIIFQHDRSRASDLKKLLGAQESVCGVLQSISDDLLDLDSLCKELDGFAILPESEKGELLEKMDSLKENCENGTEKGNAEKENLYNTLIRILKGRIDDISNTLDTIAEKINAIPDKLDHINEVLEAFRTNEDNIEELDHTHKEAEKLTLDITDVVNDNILTKDDQLALKEGNGTIVNQLVEISDHAMGKNKNLRKLIKAMMKDRIEAAWEWIRQMDQEKSRKTTVGPEVRKVKEQIQEMLDFQKECELVRLPLRYNDPFTEEMLDTVTRRNMLEAEREWTSISDWITSRILLLEDTKKAWETFRQKEIDLLDFLKAKEELMKKWDPIDLEDEESVEKRMDELKEMNGEMEVRKNYVADLHNASNSLINRIGANTATVNVIKAQADDIHDCWNSIVKQILENGSKLNMARNKLRHLEEGMDEVKAWLNDTQSVLNYYTDSATDDVVKDLMPQLMTKCDEEPLKRTALERVNSIGNELIDDVDGISHDVLENNINSLNKQWDAVTTELQTKRHKKRNRPCCLWCWRRMFLKFGYY